MRLRNRYSCIYICKETEIKPIYFELSIKDKDLDNIVSQIWNSMSEEGQRINNGGYDYELFHQKRMTFYFINLELFSLNSL